MDNLQKHLNHKFYKDVQVFREKVRDQQIRKGAEKYPEPFTTSSWTNYEIIEHAMQENVDQAHYIYACKERMDELQEKVDQYEQALKNIYNWETRSEINKTVHLSESAILAKQALEAK